jgi:hypothetical protein
MAMASAHPQSPTARIPSAIDGSSKGLEYGSGDLQSTHVLSFGSQASQTWRFPRHAECLGHDRLGACGRGGKSLESAALQYNGFMHTMHSSSTSSDPTGETAGGWTPFRT